MCIRRTILVVCNYNCSVNDGGASPTLVVKYFRDQCCIFLFINACKMHLLSYAGGTAGERFIVVKTGDIEHCPGFIDVLKNII